MENVKKINGNQARKNNLLSLFSFIILIGLATALAAASVSAATIQSSCGTLSSADTAYVLDQNVSSIGTCFTIGADNVTLDCAGFTITYNTAGGNNNAGVSGGSYDQTTITNCVIRDTNSSGVAGDGINFINADDVTVTNNIIYTNGVNDNIGIDARGDRANVSNNTIFTQGSAATNYGIRVLTDGDNSSFYDNTIYTNGTSNNYGIYLQGADNAKVHNNLIYTNGTSSLNHGMQLSSTADRNMVYNNTIVTDGKSGNSNFGINFNGASNNVLADNVISTNGAGAANRGVYLTGGVNNTVRGNTISTNGVGAGNTGVGSLSDDHMIYDNTIFTHGNSFSNVGISIDSALDNVVSGNYISTYGTTGSNGVEISPGVSGCIVDNNTFVVNGSSSHNYGIYVNHASGSCSFSGNVVVTDGTKENYGIYLNNASSISFVSNQVTTGQSNDSYAVRSQGSSTGNTFTNLLIKDSAYLIDSSADSTNSFENLTFANPNSGVNFFNNACTGGVVLETTQ